MISPRSVISWYGLRYAASPTGDLRFAAPVDIERHNPYNLTTVHDATAPGPSCFQQTPAWEGVSENNTSEDCLLLNVHKPANPASSLLPVRVFIHGGGYDQGTASNTAGVYAVTSARGQIINVEIQYRLGGFGFMNSQEVIGNGSANAGLLDQRSALEWVQRHIGAFGGDPDKVTVSGASAGGGSVLAQLQLWGGVPKPPFRAAIAGEYLGMRRYAQR